MKTTEKKRQTRQNRKVICEWPNDDKSWNKTIGIGLWRKRATLFTLYVYRNLIKNEIWFQFNEAAPMIIRTRTRMRMEWNWCLRNLLCSCTMLCVFGMSFYWLFFALRPLHRLWNWVQSSCIVWVAIGLWEVSFSCLSGRRYWLHRTPGNEMPNKMCPIARHDCPINSTFTLFVWHWVRGEFHRTMSRSESVLQLN